jgi:hypothetical protein
MGIRSGLKHSIHSVIKHNRDGSRSTQASRRKRLMLISNQLVADGYQLRHARQLKTKHIRYLIDIWLSDGLSVGTIKNRMTDLRWLTEKLGLQGVVAAKNELLNILQRKYITNVDKSIALSEGDLSRITDPGVKLSLRLQKVFGLRREESIEIRINEAHHGDKLQLKGSWCKNGRARTVAILYSEQRAVIEQCKAYVGNTNRSLVPAGKTYYEQLKRYENQLSKAGINKAHGLRHAYAQRRYSDLTRWECSVKGGPLRRQLTSQKYDHDQQARVQISHELGNARIEVVAQYLGR